MVATRHRISSATIRLVVAGVFTSAVLRVEAQVLDLDQGLSPTAVGAVDFDGYISWSTVESLTKTEQKIITMLLKRDYVGAEKLARQSVVRSPGRLVAHSLLLQSVVAQKDRVKLKSLANLYRQANAKSRLLAEQIAYSRVLAVEVANRATSASPEWQRSMNELDLATVRLDSGDVGSAIAVADAWSAGATGDFTKARKVMEASVDKNPTSISARYFLLLQYGKGVLASNDPSVKLQKTRPDLVVRQAEEVVRIDPRFRQAYYFGGLAKLQTGDRSGAADWLRKYRALNPYKKGDYYNNAGRILESLGGT